MQFTQRQRRRITMAIALWGLLSVLCTVAGPFGTLETMGLGLRFVYWGAAVAVSILGSLLVLNISVQSIWAQLALWAVFAMTIAVGVFLLNRVFFGDRGREGELLYLFGIVGITVLVVHGILWLAHLAFPQTPPEPAEIAPDIAAKFQRRLPLEARGPLVRIEAQDHYLNVVTQNGSGLILMRLSEAVEALDGVAGLLTHRSHWVALEAVTAHRRDKGRDLLVMSDGSEVPVARTRRAAAQEAGLF